MIPKNEFYIRYNFTQ